MMSQSQLQYQSYSMITNLAKSAIKTNLGRIAFAYIKQRDLENARNQYGTASRLDRFRGKMAAVKLLCVQSFRDAKSDYKRFKDIGQLNLEQRQYQQQKDYLRIKSDMLKAIPAFTILNVPGGTPFFFAYIILFPNLAPTWVLTETAFNQLQLMKYQNRVAALYRFQKTIQNDNIQFLSQDIANRFISIRNGQYNKDDGIQVLRGICSILLGEYTDGTYYLCRYSPLKKTGLRLSYLLHPIVSRFILLHKIQKFVNSNSYFPKEFSKLESFRDQLSFLLQFELNNLQKLPK